MLFHGGLLWDRLQFSALKPTQLLKKQEVLCVSTPMLVFVCGTHVMKERRTIMIDFLIIAARVAPQWWKQVSCERVCLHPLNAHTEGFASVSYWGISAGVAEWAQRRIELKCRRVAPVAQLSRARLSSRCEDAGANNAMNFIVSVESFYRRFLKSVIASHELCLALSLL